MKFRRPTSSTSVVLVVQNLPVPFDRRVWLEATTLREAGYNVTCVCPKAKGFDLSYEVFEGIEIHRYSLPIEASGPLGFVAEFIWCFIRTTMKVSRIAIESGIDILHVCNPPETYFPLGWVIRAFGRKFLFDHHDLSPEMFDAKLDAAQLAENSQATNPGDPRQLNWKNRVLRRGLLWCERMTFAAANVVITTNESHKSVATGRGKKREEDVVIVRSGPDLERLAPTEPEPHWRQDSKFMVVYLGEICEQDGVDHLIRAIKHIQDHHLLHNIRCVLVGGGPHQPVVKQYAEELGLGDVCHFTGRVSDELLCEILSSADIGVDPDPLTPWSDQSTMNKIMEYMFFELPIVSYALTEAKVSAGDAALFVEPNNEEALADGIVELLYDPDRRRDMGKIGRGRIENELSWEHSKPHLLRAYRQLANQ